jgi:hypothetical protein
MAIPGFNDLGYLPPGVYESSWSEFMERFAINAKRQRLITGLAAALRKLGLAGCRRVIIGGSFVTSKQNPNDFDGWYDDFGLDPNILDPLFNKNAREQQIVFGGRLFDNLTYEGFFRTDREGRPKGIIALDPKDLINTRS